MLFTERHEFQYDGEVFKRYDTQTALKINAEYTRKMSPRPLPKIFEINRAPGAVDHLWRMPVDNRTQIARELEIPAIVRQEKTNWVMNNGVLSANQRAKIWFSNLVLQDKDINYFPLRGDLVYWSGYRWLMTEVSLEPDAYWGQTNVWLNVVCNLTIAPMGDAKPALNPAIVQPAEEKQPVMPAPAPGPVPAPKAPQPSHKPVRVA